MKKSKSGIRVPLALYDFLIFIIVDVILFILYQGAGELTATGVMIQSILAFITIFGARLAGRIYRQIWRYGGIQCYIKLLSADGIAFCVYLVIERLLPIQHIAFAKLLAFCCMNALGALGIRMIYRYAYKCGSQDNTLGSILRLLLKIFSSGTVITEPDPDSQKIKIAIIGAGSVGVGLAEDLLNNKKAQYVARCFIDSDKSKVGRDIHGISVISEDEATLKELKKHHIQEVVFAVPNMDRGRKLELYDYYQQAGFRIKVFDYPSMDIPGRKRQLREFNIEDLLMREQKEIINDKTREYYKGKTILITGGGGSIGSELCRQLAKMEPKQLVILDIYENCAYDVQQGL